MIGVGLCSEAQADDSYLDQGKVSDQEYGTGNTDMSR